MQQEDEGGPDANGVDYNARAMATTPMPDENPSRRKQKKPSEMNEEELEELKDKMDMLHKMCHRDTATMTDGGRELFGSLRLDKKLATGHERKFKPHQAVAIIEALLAAEVVARSKLSPDEAEDEDTVVEWKDKNLCRLLQHRMGLGKTVSAIGLIAALIATMNDDALEDFKALVIVPKNVVMQWQHEFMDWLDLTRNFPEIKNKRYNVRRGVLIAHNQADVTPEALKRARIVVITPSACQIAFKTFMVKKRTEKRSVSGTRLPYMEWVRMTDRDQELHKDKKRKRKLHSMDTIDDPMLAVTMLASGVVRDSDGNYVDKNAPRNASQEPLEPPKDVPMHPLYEFAKFGDPSTSPHLPVEERARPFSIVICDEIQKCCNPQSLNGRVCKPLVLAGRYRVGLTGTPVGTRPKQMAHIFDLLDCPQGSLKQPSAWHVTGLGDSAIDRSTVINAHENYIDTADESTVDMPPVTYVNIDFDPYIGMQSDNVTDRADVQHHNNWVLRGTQAMQEINSGDTEGNVQLRRQLDGFMFQALARMQHYGFDATLGREGAKAFNDTKTAADNFDKALKRPSESVKLIYRILRDRQKAGKQRILVYSESVVELKILKNYLIMQSHMPTYNANIFDGSVGNLYMYTGDLNPEARLETIKKFLACPRGVMLMSSAGQIGANVAPGCDTMLIVGDLPYNSANLAQAVHRIRRLNQPAGTHIECITVFPRRSITTAKMDIHEDKSQRLERGLTDVDFKQFAHNGQDQRWRLNPKLMSDACVVDDEGNYIETQKMINKRRAWASQNLYRAQNGLVPLPLPPDCQMPDPMRVSELPIKPSATYITPDFQECDDSEIPPPAFIAALLQTEDGNGADQVAPDPMETSEQDNAAVPEEDFNPDEGLDYDCHNAEEEEDDEEERASKRQRHSSSDNGAASSSSNA